MTAREIEKLMDYARKHSRYGHRDSTMVLVTYRHGLRASEVCDLQWHQVELDQGRMHVRRAKSGTPSAHPIRGDEVRVPTQAPPREPDRGLRRHRAMRLMLLASGRPAVPRHR